MTSEQFAYWLQGFSELNPTLEAPSTEQWKAIQDHLKTVFVKITPTVQTAPYTTKTLQDFLRNVPTMPTPVLTC